MVQGFYTLQEAAKHLNLSAEEMRDRAEEHNLRGFFHNGTYRYRAEDVYELGRKLGGSSEPELVLGGGIPLAEGSGARTGLTPRSSASRRSSLGPKSDPNDNAGAPKSSGRSKQSAPEVFDFDLGLGDAVNLGGEAPSKISSTSRKSQVKPPASTPRRSQLKPGSESEIRLVSEGDDLSFSVAKTPPPRTPVSKMQPTQPDSKVRVGPDSASKRRTGMPVPPGRSPASPPIKPRSKLAGGSQVQDSGMRLVPMANSPGIPASSDEIPLGDLPPSTAGDSDVRLERHQQQNPSDASMIQTEEINLDEELRQQADQFPSKPAAKVRAKSNVVFPTSSPFEIADNDPSESHGSSEFDLNPGNSQGGSTDFELTPGGAADGSSDFDYPVNAGEPAEDGSNEVDLGSDDSVQEDGSSDFSLSSDSDGSSDFELGASGLSADADFSLEIPADAEPNGNDSFTGGDMGDMSLELSADDLQSYENNFDTGLSGLGSLPSDQSFYAGDSSLQQPADFELSTDDTGLRAGEQDSEFELTLDDGSSQLAPEDQVKPQGEHIFDSDFEVPAAGDSDSEILALDEQTGEESSSEFEIALDDTDASADDESASQVIALDEDPSTMDGDVQELAEGGFDQLDGEGEAAQEELAVQQEDAEPQLVEKFVEPAPWGIVPTLVMIPCVAIMFLVALMAFEMVQSAGGVNTPPGPLTRTIEKLMGIKS